jgi:hypothetical protein
MKLTKYLQVLFSTFPRYDKRKAPWPKENEAVRKRDRGSTTIRRLQTRVILAERLSSSLLWAPSNKVTAICTHRGHAVVNHLAFGQLIPSQPNLLWYRFELNKGPLAKEIGLNMTALDWMVKDYLPGRHRILTQRRLPRKEGCLGWECFVTVQNRKPSGWFASKCTLTSALSRCLRFMLLFFIVSLNPLSGVNLTIETLINEQVNHPMSSHVHGHDCYW